jgi:DNA-binding CsgD family transcriptional regulator
MAAPPRSFDTPAVAARLVSGTALCAFDRDLLEVVAWNEEAERVTGIRREHALGRPCWAVLGGRSDDGTLVCHRGCSGARLARSGWPLAPQALSIRTETGRRRVAVETVSCGDVIVHLFRPAPKAERPAPSPRVSLSPRRLEVLRLLGQGMRVRAIAARLGIREATARNHVHGLLVDLGAHSQLEAVSRGRAHGLI